MKNKQLEDYFIEITKLNWISLSEASRLNRGYLITRDPDIKDKIILGVQHLIFTTLTSYGIEIDTTAVDTNDIIQYFNLYFIEGVEKGIFINAHTLNNLYTDEFFEGLYNMMKYEEYVPINQIKNIPYEESSKQRRDKFITELLDQLEDDGLLITSDMYEKFFFGSEEQPKKKRKLSDIYNTNVISGGRLYKILRSHPMYQEIREEYQRL